VPRAELERADRLAAHHAEGLLAEAVLELAGVDRAVAVRVEKVEDLGTA
jgi:hypothetical protein